MWLYVEKSFLSGGLAQSKPDDCCRINGPLCFLGVPFASHMSPDSPVSWKSSGHSPLWCGLSWFRSLRTLQLSSSCTCSPCTLSRSGRSYSVKKLHSGVSKLDNLAAWGGWTPCGVLAPLHHKVTMVTEILCWVTRATAP